MKSLSDYQWKIVILLRFILYLPLISFFILLWSICYGMVPTDGVSQKYGIDLDNSRNPITVFEVRRHIERGLNFMRERDYDNAIDEFTLAIEKNPYYSIVYSNRAVAYMQQQKFDKAADDLNKGAEINPKSTVIHYNFVALYSLQGKIDQALDSLDKTLELGFNNYDALRKDPDLNNVRKHPEFRKICEKYKVFL